MTQSIAIDVGMSDESATIQFKIAENNSLRDIIAAVNPVVEIRGLQQTMASMNDIFIHTVTKSNRQ